jgi:hypothetical protein
MKLTKKQKKLNKKLKHMQTKSYLEKQRRKEIKQKDKAWQEEVKDRDNHRCIINNNCGESTVLNIHHLIPRENKLFRHDLDNGIVLCQFHHKFSLECSPHRNPLVFYKWMLENRKEQLDSLWKKYDINKI